MSYLLGDTIDASPQTHAYARGRATLDMAIGASSFFTLSRNRSLAGPSLVPVRSAIHMCIRALNFAINSAAFAVSRFVVLPVTKTIERKRIRQVHDRQFDSFLVTLFYSEFSVSIVPSSFRERAFADLKLKTSPSRLLCDRSCIVEFQTDGINV